MIAVAINGSRVALLGNLFAFGFQLIALDVRSRHAPAVAHDRERPFLSAL